MRNPRSVRPEIRNRRRDSVHRDVALDPHDAGIATAIARLERKSFIKDGVIPEVQRLLAVPTPEAKRAYLSVCSQYSLVSMLILASLLGTALNPLNPQDFPTTAPGLVAAFNMLSMIICCACLYGTAVFLLESSITEGTPDGRMHSIIAKADPIFVFATSMMGIAIQATAPLVLVRAWISGLDRTQCIILTTICVTLWLRMNVLYFEHLQTHWPVEAQRWTKLFFPPHYRKEQSHAAIDDLVAELRYLQQPRDKVLTPTQLGGCLDKYFGSCCSTNSPAGKVINDGAELHAFLQLVEGEVGGKLTPTAEALAKKAFEKALGGVLEQLADEALKSSMFVWRAEVSTGTCSS